MRKLRKGHKGGGKGSNQHGAKGVPKEQLEENNRSARQNKQRAGSVADAIRSAADANTESLSNANSGSNFSLDFLPRHLRSEPGRYLTEEGYPKDMTVQEVEDIQKSFDNADPSTVRAAAWHEHLHRLSMDEDYRERSANREKKTLDTILGSQEAASSDGKPKLEKSAYYFEPIPEPEPQVAAATAPPQDPPGGPNNPNNPNNYIDFPNKDDLQQKTADFYKEIPTINAGTEKDYNLPEGQTAESYYSEMRPRPPKLNESRNTDATPDGYPKDLTAADMERIKATSGGIDPRKVAWYEHSNKLAVDKEYRKRYNDRKDQESKRP